MAAAWLFEKIRAVIFIFLIPKIVFKKFGLTLDKFPQRL